MSENISTPKRRKRKPSKKAQEAMAAALPEPKGEVTMGPVIIKGIECEVVNVVPFTERIVMFNDMYSAESNDYPTNLGTERLDNFHDILAEELTEYKEISHRLEVAKDFAAKGLGPQEAQALLTAFTDMSDWLCDLQVYCASEMRRWGLYNDETLNIIMDSNASKLGEDGLPIKDERGKILKGPNYWKPEPKIMDMLRLKIAEGKANAKG